MPRISQTVIRAILWAILSSITTADGVIYMNYLQPLMAEIETKYALRMLNIAISMGSFKYIYAKEGMWLRDSQLVDPENTFMVYDDSIERGSLFAGSITIVKDDTIKTLPNLRLRSLPKICTITWC